MRKLCCGLMAQQNTARRIDDPPVLYSPAEVAARLSVSIDKVRRLMGAGAVRSVKIGRCRRVSREALAEYLATLTG